MHAWVDHTLLCMSLKGYVATNSKAIASLNSNATYVHSYVVIIASRKI